MAVEHLAERLPPSPRLLYGIAQGLGCASVADCIGELFSHRAMFGIVERSDRSIVLGFWSVRLHNPPYSSGAMYLSSDYVGRIRTRERAPHAVCCSCSPLHLQRRAGNRRMRSKRVKEVRALTSNLRHVWNTFSEKVSKPANAILPIIQVGKSSFEECTNPSFLESEPLWKLGPGRTQRSQLQQWTR